MRFFLLSSLLAMVAPALLTADSQEETSSELASNCEKNKCSPKGTARSCPTIPERHKMKQMHPMTLEQQVQASSGMTVHQTYGAKSAPYNPSEAFHVEVDALYWKAQEDDLSYAVQGDTSTHQIFKDKDLHFHWNWGFRAGIGYLFGHKECWDMMLTYTRYASKAHSAVSLPSTLGSTAVLYPTWDTQFMGEAAQHASGHWALNFNTVDLEFGKNFFVSPKFSVRPFISARGAWIHQRYRVSYIASVGGIAGMYNNIMRAHNDFDGAGIRTGGDMQFHFGRYWNLLCKLSTSLIYGRFNIVQNESADLGVEGRATLETRKWARHYNRLRADLEAFLGVQWERFWRCDHYHSAVTLGWDMAQWFAQNEMINWLNFTPNSDAVNTLINHNHGDLGLQGLTLKVEFDF